MLLQKIKILLFEVLDDLEWNIKLFGNVWNIVKTNCDMSQMNNWCIIYTIVGKQAIPMMKESNSGTKTMNLEKCLDRDIIDNAFF